MKLLSGFIFRIILISCCLTQTYGQEISGELSPADSLTEIQNTTSSATVQQTDTVDAGKVPVIRRIELSLDYLKLISLALPAETKVEGGLAIITKPNVAISIEVGYGAKMPEDHFKNAEYRVEGIYGRAGLSYILPFNPTANFYIGAKYGMSR